MKKIIIGLLMCIFIFGCSCSQTVKVKIDYQNMPTNSESSSYLYNNYGLLSYELKTIDDLDYKLTNKESFLLFVYEADCTGCMLLAPALADYVNENNLVVYTMARGTIEKHEYYKSKGVNTTPYLVLIEDGEIAYKEVMTLSQKEADASKNIETVKAWMNDHVIWEE